MSFLYVLLMSWARRSCLERRYLSSDSSLLVTLGARCNVTMNTCLLFQGMLFIAHVSHHMYTNLVPSSKEFAFTKDRTSNCAARDVEDAAFGRPGYR
jgi:hypothetical protein